MENKIYEGQYLKVKCEDQNETWRRFSPEMCKDLCSNEPGCNAFTWVENDTQWDQGKNRCCLKNITGEGKIQNKPGRISGPIECGKLLCYHT